MRDKDVIISVNSVSKKFCKDLKRSLYYGVKDIMKLGQGNTDDLRKGEFWAVSDISFELRRGDCLGLIGHNGAGKSTLLKMLNGLISPDKGSITIHGRVGALIELGAGFNPILTGRENIFNNGAVLGFSKKEMEAKMQDIIDFSEIEEFIDMPVQNYSSGMKVRLGFAVAANLEPDLLLIDEVLAVGDVGFRVKCYNKIASLLENTAIIIVSHSMHQIAKISSTILLMEQGRGNNYGLNVNEGIEAYFDKFDSEQFKKVGDGVEVVGVQVNGERVTINSKVEVGYGKNLSLTLDYLGKLSQARVLTNLVFFDKELKPVSSCQSGFFELVLGRQHRLELTLPRLQLAPGNYSMSCVFLSYNEKGMMISRLAMYQSIIELKVKGLLFVTPAPTQFIGNWVLDKYPLKNMN
jgi:lipopolysaccharide transport system ATP-binding protein